MAIAPTCGNTSGTTWPGSSKCSTSISRIGSRDRSGGRVVARVRRGLVDRSMVLVESGRRRVESVSGQGIEELLSALVERVVREHDGHPAAGAVPGRAGIGERFVDELA